MAGSIYSTSACVDSSYIPHYYHHHLFMQDIYTYIPKTNCAPREYSVAAILLLFILPISLIPVLNLLYFYISTSQSICAVPNMAVFCSSF